MIRPILLMVPLLGGCAADAAIPVSAGIAYLRNQHGLTVRPKDGGTYTLIEPGKAPVVVRR